MPKHLNCPPHLNAALVCADGTVFFGKGIGKIGTTTGEICFNTSMTGYQEIMTDPSYTGQIITFTFPHIGNVGANAEDVESTKACAAGLIIREAITPPSNYRQEADFNDWLAAQGITGISGVDTRQLTRLIRTHGPQCVAIGFAKSAEEIDVSALQSLAKAHPSMKGMELASTVSTDKIYSWEQGCWEIGQGYSHHNNPKGKHVVAIDYGEKLNILRCLTDQGCKVTVVPARTTAAEILALNPDGIFLSNGPGDPAATGEYATPVLRELIEKRIPIFGICLGHQLLAQALGASTYKMDKGHRGANHPVKNLQTGLVEITSQNHGFAVSEDNLPANVEITHISLFDGTVEGIRHTTQPVFSVQHHPEASPGPRDSFYLFRQFAELMEQNKKEKAA